MKADVVNAAVAIAILLTVTSCTRSSVYRVRAVIDGSPAAEAGIRVGDVITLLGGRPARDITLSQIRALFQREGATYVLGMQREGGREEVKVTTRRLISSERQRWHST